MAEQAPGLLGPVAPARARRVVPLAAGFALVHATLILLALHGPGYSLGDVDIVYLQWAQGIVSNTVLVGITTDFVYPVLAAVPILAALVFGPAEYTHTWLALVTLGNLVVFGALLVRMLHATGPARIDRRWEAATWWWLAFLLLLGPVALGRIDGVTAPLVILALLVAVARPMLAATLLTVATWIKVWPAAVIAALLVTSPHRGRVFVVAAGTSLLVLLAAIVLSLSQGSGVHVLSFIAEQSGRGLQIESPIAGFWLWWAALGGGATVYYDTDILTYQVTGPGTELASAVMTPLLAVMATGVLLLGVRAHRRGAPTTVVLPALSLALILVLITVNKVGSPQFITWLAAPILLGLVLAPRLWRLPAVLALVLAALTQLIYPVFYGAVLAGEPVMLMVLTGRNLLEIILLLWALRQLVQAARAGQAARIDSEHDAPNHSLYPSPSPSPSQSQS